MTGQTDLFNKDNEFSVNNGNRRQRRTNKNDKLRLSYESDSSDDQGANSDDENNNKIQQKEDVFGDDNENDMFDSDRENDMFSDDNDNGNDNGNDEDDMFASDNEESASSEKNNNNDNDDDEIKETDESVNNYYNNIEDLNFDLFKNKKEPKIEAFNLKEETNSGKFDDEGNYIPDEQEEDSQSSDNDIWLDNYNTSDINKAKQAQAIREKRQRDKEKEKDHNVEPLEILLSDLISLLEPAESPLEALARLNPKKSKKNSKTVHNNSDESINRITNVCSSLINDKQIDDIYDLTREELMRKFQATTGRPYNVERGLKRSREECDDDNSEIENIDYGEKIWEFRWIGDEDILNGPYSNYEMDHWKKTYFENKVEVRKVGETEFKNVEYIDFT
ncbi:non-essential component of U5 snRNP, putative [Candida dubliniensis CD36]|uniref:Non-essential component of U5 snRNP, putative n=1 Tax=Candida dubliniensis (strain CD36 / ATCC MYA-646 / CBS 7987 / NCPF 3949 / NRRL Y-17841) TaxID=573826 RepID=B9WM98_CANDC|nr:non-essential component of U5 snRNP, putative [Candida dubliniensis CD36]CAX40211.1 non-essential component of U5 snRNP, putative [Candida dubliniensis CD36]